MNKLNEYKGNKYTIGSPAGTAITGEVIESYGNLCLVKYNIGGVGGRNETRGIYNILLDAEGKQHLKSLYIDYNTESSKYDSPVKTTASKDVVKAKFDAMVEALKVKEQLAQSITDAKAIEAEKRSAIAKVEKVRALKLSECHEAKYKAVVELRKLFGEATSIESLLKDKKAKALIESILVYNVLTNNYNSQIQ